MKKMTKLKHIKEEAKQRHLLNKNKLIEVAKSNAITELLDIIGVNYSVIDTDGNYIMQNNSMMADISKGQIKAQDIDAISWADCQQVMESCKRKVVEEQFESRYYLSVKQPVLNNTNCIGIIVLSFDITERILLERELIYLKAKEEVEEYKDIFLKNMQHDLRTPFSGILSVSEVLLDTEKDIARKELHTMVIGSAKRLLQLLDQVLEVSKLGENPINYTEFNLQILVTEVVQLLTAEIQIKGIALSITCPDCAIKNDRMRLNRILLNLLGNAVKFTERGTISIKITLESDLMIEVSDTGMGIPQDKLDFIFDKFAKVRLSNKEHSFSGSGIGLHIVKQFVNELGGTISVKSQLGEGSTFKISLPFRNQWAK
jgi:two-component system aerobic respiration control sensor histidine kinase ArcB